MAFGQQGEMTMSKKLDINGKVATFTMSIQGGKLPDSFKAIIAVAMNFEGATIEDLYKCCASGQSARVALQAQLRTKTVSELNGLANNGLKVSFNDIMKGSVTKPIDRLLALSKDDFILELAELGIDTEQATKIYNFKHGLES